MDVNSYTIEDKGRQITFTHLGATTMPAYSQVTAVFAIPFTVDGKLVVVRLHSRGLDLPGGHVEPNETSPEQTMNREVMEEAYMTVRNPVLAEVIKSDYADTPSYMLGFGAWVDEMQEFVPNDEASERVVVTIDEFINQYDAGDKKLMHRTIERAWQLLQEHYRKGQL